MIRVRLPEIFTLSGCALSPELFLTLQRKDGDRVQQIKLPVGAGGRYDILDIDFGMCHTGADKKKCND